MNKDRFERLLGNEDRYTESEMEILFPLLKTTSILFDKMFKEEINQRIVSPSLLVDIDNHEKISQYLRIRIALQLIFVLNSKKINLDKAASDHMSSITSNPLSEHTHFHIDQIGLNISDPEVKSGFDELTRISTLKPRLYPLFLKYFYN